LPLRNDVDLVLDPAKPEFSGTIAFELQVGAPSDVVWLHAEKLTIDKASFVVGGKPVAATTHVDDEFLAVIPATPLPAGTASLSIAYHGTIVRDDGDGIYSVEEGDDHYLFTQFQATDARQAFPCFDEPSFKIPWRVTIHTKKEHVVLGNTPIESETDEAGGMKAVKLAETKPLPSYLVAFAVGPFETADAGKTRAGQPIRIVFPRGRTAAEAAWSVESAKPILDLLEDYFGTPYPYAKLDHLAVPVFNAGAMENAGLITYRDEFLLIRPEEMTLFRKQIFAVLAGHEIAHMWFGDLVTLAWWDDTWLNEAFATWMEAKVINQWKPEWDGQVEVVASKVGVMAQDSLDAARSIRQPIQSKNDIINAFDGITYRKGHAVLDMLERWIGEDTWRDGVRAYMKQHAWGNATYDDFVSAISTAAGKDLRPLFDSFITQSGVPLVSVDLTCKPGAPPTLVLEQRRYKPIGSQIDPMRTWMIPVCVRWGAGAATGRDCTMLDKQTAELPLTAKSCPQWVMPNEGGVGYYRMLPKPALLDALLARADKVLTLPERVGLIDDVNALVASGDAQSGAALSLIDKLSGDKSRHIVDASIGIVAGIDEMVPDALRPKYRKLIARLYRKRAVELGWQAKPTDDDNTKKLRPNVLKLVAIVGDDKPLLDEAKALALKWLDDRKSVDPTMVDTILAAAARHGDAALFDRIYAEAKKSTDRDERTRLLAALGGFYDPALVDRAMKLVIGDEFDIRESGGLMQGGFTQRATRDQAYQFVVANYDTIANKLPEMYRPYMAMTLVALCDEDKKAEAEKFFRPKIEPLDGGPRVLQQALEQLSLCAAAKKAQTPGVIAFLEKQP
jgi:alanyl aminopeptidase